MERTLNFGSTVNKVKNLLVFLFIIICDVVLSQVLEFSEPVPVSILNSEAEEVSPLISPSGEVLYLARSFYSENMGGEFAGTDIWVSYKDSLGNWQKPINNILEWNNHENNAVIGVRSDNEMVYLLNSYSRGQGIAFSKIVNGGILRPEILPLRWLGKNEFVGFNMHSDFNVLLMSMEGEESEGLEDLYVSIKDSLWNWSEPIHLGPTINTDGYEISPFLSKDKRRLYFASNGHGGFGDVDIFVSERLYDNWTVWSKPVNLGEKINSENFDAYFTIGVDSTIYFSSNRDGGLSDIYVSQLLGIKKDQNQKYAEQLINEARQLLRELRGENQTKEFFVQFFPESDVIEKVATQKLNELTKFLNYQSYKELILLSVAYEADDREIHERRLSSVIKYLKLSGINSDKIKLNESTNMKRGAETKLFEEKDGVVVLVSY